MTDLPYPLPIMPIAVPVPNVAAAIKVLRIAKKAKLPASYHPQGGMTAKKYYPVTHTVWIAGSSDEVKKIVSEVTNVEAEA